MRTARCPASVIHPNLTPEWEHLKATAQEAKQKMEAWFNGLIGRPMCGRAEAEERVEDQKDIRRSSHCQEESHRPHEFFLMSVAPSLLSS
ncbi:hypothetical protein AN958_08779 [Leucoagaricus sp. SymC.cos]|nr:hypothetical protein AN958_08779 [Leucoagaricus sp. SymC.cos]